MATPVGPVRPDPGDPDLWNEWVAPDDDGDEVAARGFGWPIRLVALVIVLGIVALFVL